MQKGNRIDDGLLSSVGGKIHNSSRAPVIGLYNGVALERRYIGP